MFQFDVLPNLFAYISFRYVVTMPHGHFTVSVGKSNEWVHGVLNFLGPYDEEGISIYQNGIHVGNHTIITQSSTTEPNGRIVIGRAVTEVNGFYGSVQVDELLFFNKSLTETEIRMLSQ